MWAHARDRIIGCMTTAGTTSSASSPPSEPVRGFEDTVKDFWTSRPRRARRGRKIAGVAAGIGNRYGIDPVIVRVALVVTTVLGGLGVLLYLLGWLLLPDERDEVSPLESLFGRGRSSTPPHITIGLCILLFPVTGWAFGGMWFQGSGIAVTLLLLVGLYVLHRNRGGYNRPTGSAYDVTTAPAASFSAQQTLLDPETATESNYQPPPGVWDPLGAEPMGWQLPGEDPTVPSPSEPSPPPERRRTPGGAITVGAALLTAGIGTTLSVLDVPWFTAAHVIGMTLAVLGVGMLVNAVMGRGRGLLLLAVPLAAAGLLVSTLPLTGLPGGGFGETDERPLTAAEVKPLYQRTGGSVNLDLSALDEASSVETAVHVGMGEAIVTVPETADVTFTCDVSMGDMSCLGQTDDGMGMDQIRGTEYGSDGVGGPEITLDVSSVMGDVEVLRAR